MCYMKNLKKTKVTIFQKNLLYGKFEKNHYKNFLKNVLYEKFENTIVTIFQNHSHKFFKNCAI